MIGPQVRAKTRQQLMAIANPETTGQPEAIPHVLYDTQLYTSASTVAMQFFASQQPDPTLSNMDQAGTLPDPQFFEVWNLGCDLLIDGTLSSVNVEDGALDDVAKFFMLARPVFTLVIASKNYGPYPLSFLHTSGGPFGVGYGAAAATTGVQFGTNGPPDGGWNWGGAVVIPPKGSFRVNVSFASAQTLRSGNTQVRFWMGGVLHRRVL